ncbi:MAG: hypothetical protein JKY49_17015 [Cohaesibacteraceae bacterium]|nr:hypothetical protein [Cohaesibacteraceae bacterium]
MKLLVFDSGRLIIEKWLENIRHKTPLLKCLLSNWQNQNPVSSLHPREYLFKNSHSVLNDSIFRNQTANQSAN